MGIFDFDWMDFNGDGKVDEFEQVLGFSMLEDDDLLSSGKHSGPFGSTDDDDEPDADPDEDGSDAWDDGDPGDPDGDWF